MRNLFILANLPLFVHCSLYLSHMAFNHYAKIKRIVDAQPEGWYILRIDEPTTAQNFRGETVHFDHYYRIYSVDGQPIKYCKFQQLDRLASVLGVEAAALPLVD